MSKNPCEGCNDRTLGCHSKCIAHNIYQTILRAKKQKIKDARASDGLYYDYKECAIARMTR